MPPRFIATTCYHTHFFAPLVCALFCPRHLHGGAPFGEHRRTLGSSQRAITECFGGRHGDSSRIVFVAICCSDFLSCIFLTCRSCEPVEGRGICHALQREPRASAARICGWGILGSILSAAFKCLQNAESSADHSRRHPEGRVLVSCSVWREAIFFFRYGGLAAVT